MSISVSLSKKTAAPGKTATICAKTSSKRKTLYPVANIYNIGLALQSSKEILFLAAAPTLPNRRPALTRAT
jgi:hypothetical protein